MLTYFVIYQFLSILYLIVLYTFEMKTWIYCPFSLRPSSIYSCFIKLLFPLHQNFKATKKYVLLPFMLLNFLVQTIRRGENMKKKTPSKVAYFRKMENFFPYCPHCPNSPHSTNSKIEMSQMWLIVKQYIKLGSEA